MKKERKDEEMSFADGGVVPDLGNVPIPTQATPQSPLQPPPVSPIQSILAQSQGLGAQMAGQYTPQMRNQLYQAMLERQNSMPQGIGAGLASVGDAIARGYGRSNTDFLNNTLKGQKEATAEGLGAFDTAGKMNMQQTQAGMELGRMDPTSQISKLHQDAYEEALKPLGYTKEAIAKMPASQIDMLAQVGLKRADIETQKELKEATIQLQAMLGSATIKNQQAERAQAAKNAALEANKETSKHWLAHPVDAYHASKAIAAAGQPEPTPAAAGPHGTSVTQNGHTYTWNPATKKYE